jgi:N-methylhydantoinase A
MKLDVAAARKAIETHIAKPMGLSIEEAAAGMYRVACNNMAQGVREVTIKRGFDPREFPFIPAGGAGPIHSCLICEELEIPFQIVPRESSVLCAFGMLMSELKHDFVRTFVADLPTPSTGRAWAKMVDEMIAEGARQLDEERIPESRRRYDVKLDCRYIKQFHEVVRPTCRARLIRQARRGRHRRRTAPRAQPALRLLAGAGERADRDHQRPRAGAGHHRQAAPSARRRGAARTRPRRSRAGATPTCRRTARSASVPVYDGHRLRYGQPHLGARHRSSK